MLQRIESIHGIGLLHQANGKPYKFERATLVYADNGRGKSTLATILRAVATNQAQLVKACRTLDGTNEPEVVLQFDNGHKVTFKNEAWSEVRPDLLVFDADFIDRNVHSGGEVSSDHRRHLLEFALGEAAVAARNEVDQATADSRRAAQAVQDLEGKLAEFHVGMRQDEFRNSPQVPDLDSKIGILQKRISAANNIAAIQGKQAPNTVFEPTVDLGALFSDLGSSLQGVHENAERLVKAHIVKLGGGQAEGWLGQGGQFANRSACPYCDQDISGSDLVRAYRTHFDAAYANLKRRVAGLDRHIASATSNTIEGFSRGVELAATKADAWAEQISIPAIYFDRAAADAGINAFHQFVTELIQRKQLSPMESIGNAGDEVRAADLWKQVLTPLRAGNDAIKLANGLINAYKAELSTESASELQKQLDRLNLTKVRYDPPIVDLFSKLDRARTAATSAETTKKGAREKLDALMSTTLRRYQLSINTLLTKFGASFSIEGMGANFRGNAPRAKYGLLLRGKPVSIEGGTPPFAMALSEGDKRTLAFAFFVASTLDDPNLTNRIVVIDDPMCSLDMNRRHHTRVVLKNIGSRCEQLIVLAHDAYFLRDLRDTLRKDDKAKPVGLFQLVAVSAGYTDFAELDIDKECESPYAKHHRLLYEFTNGQGGKLDAVAKGIRPLLEGYLHRRFPGLLPKNLLFGEVIGCIQSASEPNPLCHAKNLVDELTEINDYAGQLHHDTNPDADTVAITATELKSYADRALNVVHRGAPPQAGDGN